MLLSGYTQSRSWLPFVMMIVSTKRDPALGKHLYISKLSAAWDTANCIAHYHQKMKDLLPFLTSSLPTHSLSSLTAHWCHPQSRRDEWQLRCMWNRCLMPFSLPAKARPNLIRGHLLNRMSKSSHLSLGTSMSLTQEMLQPFSSQKIQRTC